MLNQSRAWPHVLLALSCFVLSVGALGLSVRVGEARADSCPIGSSEVLELTLDRVEFDGKPISDVKAWGAKRARVVSVSDNTDVSTARVLACVEIMEDGSVAQRRCFEQAVSQ